MIKIFVPDEFKPDFVRQAGIEDGARGIPGLHDDHVSAFEGQIVDRGEQVLREWEGNYNTSEAKLRERFFIARYDYWDAERLYRKRYAANERPVSKKIPTWLYVFCLVVIVLVELPVNFSALSILGDAPLLVAPLAILLGVVFMIAAHLIGMTIRHKGPNFATVFSILVVIGIIVGLAYLRADYFLNPEDPEDISLAMKGLDPKALATLFGLMNILFVLVACWLSFLAHDQDEHYAQIVADRNQKRVRAEMLQTERGKECAAIEASARDYIEMVHGLIREYRRANLGVREPPIEPSCWRLKSAEQLLRLDSFQFTPPDNSLELPKET